MERLYKLKYADQKYRSVLVAHDMTKTECEECKKNGHIGLKDKNNRGLLVYVASDLEANVVDVADAFN